MYAVSRRKLDSPFVHGFGSEAGALATERSGVPPEIHTERKRDLNGGEIELKEKRGGGDLTWPSAGRDAAWTDRSGCEF